ncbi:MAG: hypothetical protein LIO53_00180 [Oscillospiraceae bacterium]|nr:hypothetical protein [Oscillospiraceae bacterium]
MRSKKPEYYSMIENFIDDYRNAKAECNVCRTVMVWKIKSPRHSCFDTYAPVIIGA